MSELKKGIAGLGNHSGNSATDGIGMRSGELTAQVTMTELNPKAKLLSIVRKTNPIDRPWLQNEHQLERLSIIKQSNSGK
jgi:hypothetical protein